MRHVLAILALGTSSLTAADLKPADLEVLRVENPSGAGRRVL
ncbi:MAG: hypothetical protein RL309_1316 [Verrucomicrobiota bacterium]